MAVGLHSYKTFVLEFASVGHDLAEKVFWSTMPIREYVPLKNLNTFKTGGKARYFFDIKSNEDFFLATDFINSNSLDFFVLGEGSNVLISDDDFDGMVIRVMVDNISWDDKGKNVLVTAEAGANWDNLVKQTIDRGLYGLENLSGIPGSVGGAPIQNIGAYGAELKDVINHVKIFDIENKNFKIFSKEECLFGYRDSVFKKPELKKMIIAEVSFLLSTVGEPNLSYKDLNEYFKYKPSLKDIREAVLEIRNKKFPNLKKYGTAGSFFKNPIIEKEKYLNLLNQFPNLPSYPVENGKVKIPLAWIIDKICGLKGYREENVGIFENQAIVIVNFGGATAKEIKNFSEEIKKIVKEKTGIEIEEEVREI